MAPNRRNSGGGAATPRDKQQRSISSFFSAAASKTPTTGESDCQPSGREGKSEQPEEGNAASEELNASKQSHAEEGGAEKLTSPKAEADAETCERQTKKRRSTDQEVAPSSPPESKVGKRLKVYWPSEDDMFPGVVVSYDKVAGKHKIIYDDGDEEDIVLATERVEWLEKARPGRRITRKSAYTLVENETSTVNKSDGKEKRPRKRYVASSSDESDRKEPGEACKEDEVQSKAEAEVEVREDCVQEQTKRRRVTGDHVESQKEKANALKEETLQTKETLTAAAVVESYGDGRSLLLAGEALERFGSRVSKKFSFLKHRKDAAGRLPESPNFDARTLFLPSEFTKSLTGGQRQWWEFKAKHMDKVLLFKMGKFYEMFEMDAHVGARDLDLQYMKGEQPHCGFPEKNYFENVDRLVRKGHRVLVVEQTETPEQLDERKRKTGAKDKVVRREICAIITRGTVVDSGMVADSADPSYLLSLTEKQDDRGGCVIGVCVADTSRSLFMLGQVVDDSARTKLRSILTEIRPVEVVKPRGLLTEATLKALKEHTRQPLISELKVPDEFWPGERAVKELKSFYASSTTKVIPPALQELIALASADTVISAFGGCISYLRLALLDAQLLGLGRIELLPGSDLPRPSSETFNVEAPERFMVLDSAALENLDILENSSNGGVSGTLLGLLDHCATPFGRRLLKRWIVRPLLDVDQIVQRQTAINDLQGVGEHAVSDFRKELAGIPDLEKLLARLSANSGANGRNASNVVLYEDAAKKQIKELVAALRGCQKMIKAASCFQQCLHQVQSERLRFLLTFGKGFPNLEPLLQYFENAFDWSKAEATGRVAMEDDSSETASDPRDKLERYLKKQRKFFKNEEITYVTVGKDTYLLEIPEELHAKVPREYELRSSKKGYHRYWTPEIKELLQELNSCESERELALKGVLQKLTKRFCEDHDQWLSAIRAVSELDALTSLSCVRLHMEGEVCFPKFLPAGERTFKATTLRHPIVAVGAAANSPFVPNDVVLGGDGPHFMLLTGPNMGGKSTLLRQVCLAMILAQVGAEVPAEALELSPVDRLFVRMGAKDHIMSAQSTFLVELLETAEMLRCATRNSFVALDELGRGTATSDGQAIAHAVLHYLAHTTQCRGMFSSHYHKLANDYANDPAIGLHHMACEVGLGSSSTEAVTFLYKLSPGACPKSYGVNVARLAGMPESVLSRASLQSAKLEQEEQSRYAERSVDQELVTSVIRSTSCSELLPLWSKLRVRQ